MLAALGWVLLALVLGLLLGRVRWRWPRRPKVAPRHEDPAVPTLVPDDEAVTRLRDIPGFEQMSKAQQREVMATLKRQFLKMRGRSA